MLKQRVITALVLLAFLLPALFYPSPEPFCALTLLMIVGAGWEWARLNGVHGLQAWGIGAALGVLLALLWWSVGLDAPMPWLWQGSALIWVLLTTWLLRRGVPGWADVPRLPRLIIGLVLIAVAWWAMAQARYLGVGMLLSMMLLVWMADIAAYFGGKAFGKRKLAPAISPGKSWEGVYSGGVGVLLLALGWLWLGSGDSLYSRLWAMGPALFVLGILFLTCMSVAGDLIESLIKRSAGVKDSSQLLPGHGGVLDRVDALLPVMPLAMMLVSYQ
ncbi:phosphatidate cytidylyltransferase [Hydrogenophaga aquatica]